MSVGVGNPNFHVTNRLADTAVTMLARRAGRDDRRRLGQAVTFQDHHPEPVAEFGPDTVRQRLAPTDRQVKRAKGVGRGGFSAQQGGVHARNGDNHGDLLGRDGPYHGGGAESRDGVDGCPQDDRNEYRGGQSENMKGGEDIQNDLSRIDVPGGNGINTVAVQVLMGQLDSFGGGRGSGSVQDDRRFIRIDGRCRGQPAEAPPEHFAFQRKIFDEQGSDGKTIGEFGKVADGNDQVEPRILEDGKEFVGVEEEIERHGHFG